ncbi:ATP-binding protein [Falsiroseomonas ponticola]|uniref:ATP-binding protein n=1 Tax=Falsiroseomonas ponticola TaxID=2786951 RepID=UPI00193147B6|nr:ATP-binding protein [Roseomonas ponticola]
MTTFSALAPQDGTARGPGAGGAPLLLLRRAAVGMVVAASIAGAWWLAARVTDDAAQTEAARVFARAELDALAADGMLRRIAEDGRALRSLAQRWLQAEGPEAETRREEIELSLRDLLTLRSLPVFHLIITGTDGVSLWQSGPGLPAVNLADRPHVQVHRGGAPSPWFGQPVASRATGQLVVPVTMRLEDQGGRFAGVLVMHYRPADLGRALAMRGSGSDTALGLMRTDGVLLAHSSMAPEMVGRRILPEAVRQVSEGARVLHHRTATTAEQEVMLVVLRASDQANIIAVAGQTAAGALAPVVRVRNLSLATAGGYSLAALLMLAFGYGAVRQRRLRREAAMLRAGRAEVERLQGKLPVVIFLRKVFPDGSSRILYRTGDIAGVTGWTNGALDGLGPWDEYVEESSLSRAESNALVLRDGFAQATWKLRQPDGSARRMLTQMERLSVNPAGGGEIVGYVRDLTAEHSAMEREAAARQELDDTLALAPVIVFRAMLAAGARAMIEQGRPWYRELFVSRSVEPVSGWTPEALAAEGGLPGVLEPWDSLVDGIEALRRDGAWAADLGLRHARGGSIVVRMTVRLVAVEGEALSVVGYIADVTAERDAKARAIGSARLASLGELAAGLAHELKQPLQAIELAVSNAHSAQKRGNMAAIGQRLDRITTYTRRANQVIEHLRRLARGTDDTTPAEAIHIEEALAGVLALMAGPLRDGGVVTRVELTDPPPRALGHNVALEQVLVNLLANARDAMQALPPEEQRLVTLKAETLAEERVLITVSDTGGGIPPQVMARLFEPFVTTKGLERGTGLGLSICQGLIRRMGGTITATNEGPGAVFRIVLPAAPAAEAAEPARDSQAAA